MIRVYCDVCGLEIVEDKGCEDEGIDWKELQLRSSIDNKVKDDIEHICSKCEPLVKHFFKVLQSPRMKDELMRKSLLSLLTDFARED